MKNTMAFFYTLLGLTPLIAANTFAGPIATTAGQPIITAPLAAPPLFTGTIPSLALQFEKLDFVDPTEWGNSTHTAKTPFMKQKIKHTERSKRSLTPPDDLNRRKKAIRQRHHHRHDHQPRAGWDLHAPVWIKNITSNWFKTNLQKSLTVDESNPGYEQPVAAQQQEEIVTSLVKNWSEKPEAERTEESLRTILSAQGIQLKELSQISPDNIGTEQDPLPLPPGKIVSIIHNGEILSGSRTTQDHVRVRRETQSGNCKIKPLNFPLYFAADPKIRKNFSHISINIGHVPRRGKPCQHLTQQERQDLPYSSWQRYILYKTQQKPKKTPLRCQATKFESKPVTVIQETNFDGFSYSTRVTQVNTGIKVAVEAKCR